MDSFLARMEQRHLSNRDVPPSPEKYANGIAEERVEPATGVAPTFEVIKPVVAERVEPPREAAPVFH